MSDGSRQNEEEAWQGEDSLPFPTEESGDVPPSDDHLGYLTEQETYFSLLRGPHLSSRLPNSPAGVFYSIHLPPSGRANSGYHSIRPPSTEVHFQNYMQRHSINSINDADDNDDFGHSDLSESLQGSYNSGMANLREVSLGDRSLMGVPAESSLNDSVSHVPCIPLLEVNDGLYATGPTPLQRYDNSHLEQTCRKSVYYLVSEEREAENEEEHIEQTDIEQTDIEQTDIEQTDIEQTDIEQTSVVSVNTPTLELTSIAQTSGEQNVSVNVPVIETVPRQAASTSGYHTGTDAEPVQRADSLQTLVKCEKHEPSQHSVEPPEQGQMEDLQGSTTLTPASGLASRLSRHTHRSQEALHGEEIGEDSDGDNKLES
ncbi:uncharacterized protein [Haliotis cracherodii]|uniref:uncharacterized protein n=1 Tax=Haliotis cracherodii TaxID=6455 RepID=UPI0039EC5A0D